MSKILVVDDEDDVREMLAEGLRGYSHEVSEARGGIEALRRYDPFDFDILVTDIIMPDGEGFEFIGNVKKHYPRVAILAISGGGTHLTPETLGPVSLELGANAFLKKPFDLHEFASLVGELAPPGKA